MKPRWMIKLMDFHLTEKSALYLATIISKYGNKSNVLISTLFISFLSKTEVTIQYRGDGVNEPSAHISVIRQRGKRSIKSYSDKKNNTVEDDSWDENYPEDDTWDEYSSYEHEETLQPKWINHCKIREDKEYLFRLKKAKAGPRKFADAYPTTQPIGY